MTDEARRQAAIEEVLGLPGRMIARSKGQHARRYPDHVLVFNANLCIAPAKKLWWGDLDLTRDEPRLVEVAARLGETLFVLYEYDGRFQNERRPLLDQAVYEVTTSGHYRLAHRWIERRRDGSLGRRPVHGHTGARDDRSQVEGHSSTLLTRLESPGPSSSDR